MANRNRDKGNRAERQYASEFKELGFSHCQTARYGSRMHDDAGIDLINTPGWNVQVKAGQQRGMNLSKVLRQIDHRLDAHFPESSPEHDYTNIIIWKRDVGRGKRRDKYDELVIMSKEDFKKMMK